jgi:transposase
MRRCPKCGTASAWQLADGRLKCRSCNHRYSGTSVWDSIRCPDEIKHALLEGFVAGLPASRTGHAGCPAINTRERFYRLTRATCAHAEHLRGPLPALIHGPAGAQPAGPAGCATFRADGAPGEIVIGLIHRAGRVRVAQVPLSAQVRLCRQFNRDLRPGRLLFTHEQEAFALLPVWSDYVLLPEEPRDRPRLDAARPLQRAWSDALGWLGRRRRIPLRQLHLHLGEVCFRANHRGDRLGPSLLRCMQRTGIREVRRMLAAN